MVQRQSKLDLDFELGSKSKSNSKSNSKSGSISSSNSNELEIKKTNSPNKAKSISVTKQELLNRSDNNKNEYLTRICIQVFKSLIEAENKLSKHRGLKVNAEFYPYTNLKLTVRKRKNRLIIRMSDVLSAAPESALSSAAQYILSQHLKIDCPSEHRKRYRDYIYSDTIRSKVGEMRRSRAIKKVTGVKGKYFDLDECLSNIDKKYFAGRLPKFNLAWSLGRSKWRYGYYDSDLNTIVVSRQLDKKSTPQFMIEYILYHEALHWQYPTKYNNGRLKVHTKEFKQAEKVFEEFDQVKKWLKKSP